MLIGKPFSLIIQQKALRISVCFHALPYVVWFTILFVDITDEKQNHKLV